MTIAIRTARIEDASLLAAAERETARTPGLLRSLPHEISDTAFADRIAALEAPGLKGRYIVAIDHDDTIVGHALLDPISLAQSAHVFRLTIIVHPGRTDRGVGRMLMNDLIAWSRQDPRVEKIELFVRATNVRAIHLYRQCGFVEEGRLNRALKRATDGVYVDDLMMALFTK
jgi:RimJ/RimL family protein N-acetyltransferase